MVRFIYSLLLYIFIPFAILRLIWRLKKNHAYGRRWNERFGFIKPLPRDKPIIWVHAVSVGETIASAPLVMALMKSHPAYRILITTMTPTASDQVTAIYGDRVEHKYMPYDLPDALYRYLNRTMPTLVIIFETELWPNTVAACKKRGIPVIIANARLSERSAKGYQRIGRLTRNMLNQLSVVACQNREDGKRFVRLGLNVEKLQITGSVKFDINITAETLNAAKAMRANWDAGFSRKAQVLIAASTHQEEEQLIINAFINLKKQHPNLLLVVVPRHLERFDSFYDLACNNGLTVKRYNQDTKVTPNTQVILGDVMGEMMKLYAASDIAFVGGSLVERGGHNMLEPAVLGLPVLSGPHTFNFHNISTSLEQAGGLIFVNNSEELATEVDRLLTDVDHYENTKKRAKQFVNANRGALARLLEIITKVLANSHH
ncbi:MAG: lipid IV(A) 3-deoxy-D-manno-octulosonic acid transferase [Candidatus Endonucleobacter bathymodioli]|uniref:3-deoxy-D-manno-octulosonic acid transferase n=1 Tax=Candidatus Endonucleibacter bathymodioli TaxID=539814 RepID=A0AA90NVR8_9GAMM|nr:lipid IV(A) 3-deoxy-D-manno-octulosonic acid transferase [Candidatus Endonucleobacter bathymodioli]